eukprot:symbB.v1.2.000159.t1/scaffold9.1/size550961/15
MGLRNSLLVAPMPTASTAQILGNNESFEPYTQNLYVRRVLSGEFVQVNRHLLKDLISRGLYNEDLRMQLIAENGSDLYKTVWEIKQRVVLDMAADRGKYIDQSQSLNIHMTDATTAKLTSMHFHGWERGLKTGIARDVEEPQRLKHSRFDHGRNHQDWGTGPTGQRLGGTSDGVPNGAAGNSDARARALEAAERRQVPQGVSKEKAKEMTEQKQREELLGRLTEHYQRQGEEMPMGLKLASVEQLKKHLDMLRNR